MMEKNVETVEIENEIEVKKPILLECSNAVRVCDPESFFEMIEQCKICGRCV
jgi:hypothetical protein